MLSLKKSAQNAIQQLQTIVHAARQRVFRFDIFGTPLAGCFLGAAHGVLNGASDGSLGGELLSNHAVAAERTANCFADAADCTLLCLLLDGFFVVVSAS